jgi:uncharacterized protein
MINRTILKELKILLKEYPVVTILGPRQAGKTTLAKKFLKSFEYSNLELPENRHLASNDPKAYLGQFKSNVIIDEIQRVPELLSYIQTIVDEDKKNGKFILTGSHQLKLHEAVSQSLAGRTAILNLLPLSILELKKANIKYASFEEYCFNGFLPRVYDQKQRPSVAYSNYYQTYVERDLRLLINLKDLSIFEKFFKLLAGRVGQIIDYTGLSNDVGVDIKTIKNWLSILEASFIVYKLNPFYNNFGKRIIKTPKYYFIDTGLLCFLLGIEKKEQILRDPLLGHIFENFVLIECLKARYNFGKLANLYFYRDSNANEIDILYQKGAFLVPIEIKASSTFSNNLLKGIKAFKNINANILKSYLIYNGANIKLSDNVELVKFNNISKIFNE